MAQKNTERAERVTLVHATRGTRITVSAALSHRMSGYRLAGTAGAPPDGKPSEAWTLNQLRDHATSHNIDLGGATRKADIVAAIDAAKGDDDSDDDS